MARSLFILWIIMLIITPTALIQAQSPPNVTPNSIEVTLDPGNCSDETVTVALGEAPTPLLDVVLMIDVTGSMDAVINSVTRSAEQVVTDIRSLVPDTSFALVTLADYPQYGGNSTDYPYRLDQDFTQDSNVLQTALNNITLTDGGDNPESYLRALYESQHINWRTGSRRIVILFGDSYPHDPDPGPDEIEGTDDDIDFNDLLSDLSSANITVLGIYTEDSVENFYQTLAVQTGGQAFHLNDVEHVAQVIQNLMKNTLSNIHTLTLHPTTPGSGWVQWEPTTHSDVPPGETREFDVTLCVPQDTAGGDYNLDITVTGDGATMGDIPVIIHVPGSTSATATPLPAAPPRSSGGSGRGGGGVSTLPPSPAATLSFQWWWLLIPIAALILLALLWWLLSRRPARGVVSRPTSRDYSAPGPAMRKTPRRRPPSDITYSQPRKRKRK